MKSTFKRCSLYQQCISNTVSLNGFKRCQTILFVHATSLKGRFKGQLLTAIAKVGKNCNCLPFYQILMIIVLQCRKCICYTHLLFVSCGAEPLFCTSKIHSCFLHSPVLHQQNFTVVSTLASSMMAYYTIDCAQVTMLVQNPFLHYGGLPLFLTVARFNGALEG